MTGRSLLAWPGVPIALASAALFGVSTPFVKLLLGGGLDPWLLAGLLYLGAGLGLGLTALARGGGIGAVASGEEPVPARPWRRRCMWTIPVYALAALSEIGGCFAFWAWLRLGKTPLWLVPGMAALVLFAWTLTRTEVAFAGRAYAAYGGVYIFASLGMDVGGRRFQAGPVGRHRCGCLPYRSDGHHLRTTRRGVAGAARPRHAERWRRWRRRPASVTPPSTPVVALSPC